MSITCSVSSHRNKPCVQISNSHITVKVSTSGGNIVSVTSSSTNNVNPLWEPPWPTVPVGLRKVAVRFNENLFSQKKEDVLESQLLSTIGGHSLCCDVFGKHSKGEVERSNLSFHGEAGLKEWEVTKVTKESLTMSCRLQESQLFLSREYTVVDNLIKVTETMTNLVGFQRALGRSQHVTIGSAMLGEDHNADDDSGSSSSTIFSTNCDIGMTWPEDNGIHSNFSINESFKYPFIPRKDTSKDDWRCFPRCHKNSDLCTMRINPMDDIGWFLVEKNVSMEGEGSSDNGGVSNGGSDNGANGGGQDSGSSSSKNGDTTNDGDESICFGYFWKRKDFPWLVTWEENNAREQGPWNNQTVCRGLEFGSYAMPLGRQWNVEKSSMFDTKTFEWLDAYEEKKTTFWLTLFKSNRKGESKKTKEPITFERVSTSSEKNETDSEKEITMIDQQGLGLLIHLSEQ